MMKPLTLCRVFADSHPPPHRMAYVIDDEREQPITEAMIQHACRQLEGPAGNVYLRIHREELIAARQQSPGTVTRVGNPGRPEND